MFPGPVIVLAAADGPGLDLIIWVVAGAVWVIAQLSAARRRKEQKGKSPPPHAAQGPAAGRSPEADELAEIFKRLGADIPATPPPAPRATRPLRPPPAAHPAPRATAYRVPTRVRPPPAPPRPPPGRVQPEIARRLARARQEAADAARQAESVKVSVEAAIPGVHSRVGETRALDTATRHTGAILPRLYAMSMRLATLPSLPMPGFDRTHNPGVPLPIQLHTRKELRNAIVAQTVLRPPKAISP